MINHIHGIGSKAFALLLSMDRIELRDKEKANEGAQTNTSEPEIQS